MRFVGSNSTQPAPGTKTSAQAWVAPPPVMSSPEALPDASSSQNLQAAAGQLWQNPGDPCPHRRLDLWLVRHQIGAEIDAFVGVVKHRKGARIALDPRQRLVETVASQQQLARDDQFVSRIMERKQRD